MDGPSNPFKNLSKLERFAIAVRWVERVRLAATPDNFDHALALAEARIGRIVADENGWSWIPIGEVAG